MIRPYTVEVPAFLHEEVQGWKVDTEGLALGREVLRDCVAFEVENPKDWPAPSEFPLAQISPSHGRSYEISPSRHEPWGAHEPTPIGLWEDGFGNRYTSLSVKGNNASQQRIMASATAPSGYIPYGLQEHDALGRVLQASEILRGLGVDTEWIVRVLEPQKLPLNGELVSINAYKKAAVNNTIQEILATPDSTPAQRADYLEEIKTIVDAVEPMVFFATVRAMLTNERITDITYPGTKLVNGAHFERAILAWNIATNGKLDPNKREDVDKYLTEILPANIGRNLGKLHAAELTHGFPHLGNITATGGLVDLDSVQGAVLGDEPRETDDYLSDVNYVFNLGDHGFGSLLQLYSFHGNESAMGPVTAFLDSYINERLQVDLSDGQKMDVYRIAQALIIEQTTSDKQTAELMLAYEYRIFGRDVVATLPHPDDEPEHFAQMLEYIKSQEDVSDYLRKAFYEAIEAKYAEHWDHEWSKIDLDKLAQELDEIIASESLGPEYIAHYLRVQWYETNIRQKSDPYLAQFRDALVDQGLIDVRPDMDLEDVTELAEAIYADLLTRFFALAVPRYQDSGITDDLTNLAKAARDSLLDELRAKKSEYEQHQNTSFMIIDDNIASYESMARLAEVEELIDSSLRNRREVLAHRGILEYLQPQKKNTYKIGGHGVELLEIILPDSHSGLSVSPCANSVAWEIEVDLEDNEPTSFYMLYRNRLSGAYRLVEARLNEPEVDPDS